MISHSAPTIPTIRASTQARASAPPHHPPVEFSAKWAGVLLLVDVLAFMISCYAAMAIMQHNALPALTMRELATVSSVVLGIVWLVLFEKIGLYQRSFALSVKDEVYCTIAALCIGIVPIFFAFWLLPHESGARLQLVLTLGFAIAIDGGARAIAHVYRNAYGRRRPQRIVLVGQAERIASAGHALGQTSADTILHIPVENIEATLHELDLSRSDALDAVPWLCRARDWKCDTLLLTEMLPPAVMPHILEITAQARIKLAFAPPRVQTHAYSFSMQRFGNQGLLVPTRLKACTPSAQFAKRCFDLIVAVAALCALLPIFVLVASAVYLDDRGPIIYRQARVGKQGRIFTIWKFRSMPIDAEASSGPVWTVLSSDAPPRTTRVGKFLRRSSLDELPQLINVIRGEMSLVGPRPERPRFVEQFRNVLPRYDERHLVRPGITGWSHIHMKRNHDQSQIGERLAYDLFYVEHWSLFMDVSIMLKTAAEVFFQKAA